MEKPERRLLEKNMMRDHLQYDKGYNHACDDWEAYHNEVIAKFKEALIWCGGSQDFSYGLAMVEKRMKGG